MPRDPRDPEPAAPLRPLAYEQVSDLLDHTDVSKLLGDSPGPADVAPAAATTPPASTSDASHLRPEEVPPGIDVVTLPDGTRTLAYTHNQGVRHDRHDDTPSTPPPDMGIPRWAKTTALLVPTIGAGLGATCFGIHYAAPGLMAMTDALWATVALIATGGITVAAVVRAARRRPGTTVHQHISANGWFARAHGTGHLDKRRR